VSESPAAIEEYPLDNKGAKIDTTMAYVGTMTLFKNAGFTKPPTPTQY